MKKLLVLGDSLTLPRNTPEACAYEQTWPVLLKQFYEVHQVSIGGGTVRDIYRQIEYHIAFKPDYVILQSGIVDCAPRALSAFELEVLNKIWLTRKLVLPFVKQNTHFLRKWRNKKYSNPNVYRDFLVKIKKRFSEADVYALGILPGNIEYERTVPGINDSISLYNRLLRDTFAERFISLDNIDANGVMSDHIHLNKLGHEFVFHSVKARLNH